MKKKFKVLFAAVYSVIMIIAFCFLFSNKELLKTIGSYLGLAGSALMFIFYLTVDIVEKRNKKRLNNETEQDKTDNNDY